MRLLKYTLQNWGPHKEQTLHFPEKSKTIAICGENDRGKSWIVRGIGFTLSIGRNEYGDQSSIHSGEQQAHHKLVFEHLGKTYEVEKFVNGKGSEEEGTVTKINGTIVNRSEYEEFYKNNLGLPHPSIWLPICISMQNETDFHLRSKKRDREEALRAICQLHKIDNWKDSLQALQKEEDRSLLETASKVKGALEQIETELLNLQKKISDQEIKLKTLKTADSTKDNCTIPWEETTLRAKKFEDCLKENQRKTLESANIQRQVNLLENSIARALKDLSTWNKKLEDHKKVEKKHEIYKYCLQELRIQILEENLEENNSKLRTHRTHVNTLGKELKGDFSPEELKKYFESFNLSEKEEELSKLSQLLFSLKDRLSRVGAVNKVLNLNGPINKTRLQKQIKTKRGIKELLVGGLIEGKAINDQTQKGSLEISRLCEKLKIKESWPINIPTILGGELATQEIENISNIIKHALHSKLLRGGDHPKEICPVCEHTLDSSQIKSLSSQATQPSKGDLSSLADSKLKLIFTLDELIKSHEKLKRALKIWEEEFGNQQKLESEIKNLDLEIAKLEELLSLTVDLEKELSANNYIPPITEEWDAIVLSQRLFEDKQALDEAYKKETQCFNKISQLNSEISQLERENKRLIQQIEFYIEEKKNYSFDKTELSTAEAIIKNSSDGDVKLKISEMEEELSEVKEILALVGNKNEELGKLKIEKETNKAQAEKLNNLIEKENTKLAGGMEMPTPEGFSENSKLTIQNEGIKHWEQISSEWQKREIECQKLDTIISLGVPRIKELELNQKALKEKLKEFEKTSRQISSARKLINFLDYKNAPRKLLEGVVTNLFDLTNRLGESLDVGIKLKLGKNLEFLTQQSRAGKWIEQKTERLGHGKGAILGICFRLACQKLLLPETGFLILDEPTANVDIKRKGLFKLFLQNLSEQNYTNDEQSSKGSQIILIEHDEDVVELCHTKVEIK